MKTDYSWLMFVPLALLFIVVLVDSINEKRKNSRTSKKEAESHDSFDLLMSYLRLEIDNFVPSTKTPGWWRLPKDNNRSTSIILIGRFPGQQVAMQVPVDSASVEYNIDLLKTASSKQLETVESLLEEIRYSYVRHRIEQVVD